METTLKALCLLLVILVGVLVVCLCLQRRGKSAGYEASHLESQAGEELQRQSELLRMQQKEIFALQDRRMVELFDMQDKRLAEMTESMLLMRRENEFKLEKMQQDNALQLEKMRQTVDEKLQTTLDEKLTRSFRMVSTQLDAVSRGLGEMQNLAAGVGDLKNVLSNVKTRGILGEIQLEAILNEILAPGQFATNIATRPGSTQRVEFAVLLPGNKEGERIYLPIDAKFPQDRYQSLLAAYDTGDARQVQARRKDLEYAIKKAAKDIHEKYVEPPYTTDFAILFLPFEGLYAEVVRLGMIEELQASYKINIAGPANMAALLNSLQMGFRTLAIQQHSDEIWQTLAAVKTEFNTFSKVLLDTKKKLDGASEDLEKLIGVRTRKMQAKLQQVGTLSPEEMNLLSGQKTTKDDSLA